MAVKKNPKAHPFQRDSFTVSAIIGKEKSTKSGDKLEPVRTFSYHSNQKEAINVSLIETSDGTVSYIDAVCWNVDEFPSIKKLKLKEGDKVELSVHPVKRDDGTWGMVFNNANDLKRVEAI